MDKFSAFFKNHPLLALFLTSVITICCINLAITVQSKRFDDKSSDTDTNSWVFGDRSSEPDIPFPKEESGDNSQAAFSDLTEPAEGQNEQFPYTVEKPVTREDFFVFGESQEGESTEVSPEDPFAAIADNGFGTEVSETPASAAAAPNIGTAAEEIAAAETAISDDIETSVDTDVDTEIEFFAEDISPDAIEADTAGTAVAETAEVAETETAETEVAASQTATGDDAIADITADITETAGMPPVDFFDDMPAGVIDEPVADAAPVASENPLSEEDLSEGSLPSQSEVAETSAAETQETAEPVDFFDVAVTADPEDELVTTDLNWVPASIIADSGETAPRQPEEPDTNLGWDITESVTEEGETSEIADGAEKEPASLYEPNEPEQIVAERFDGDKAAAESSAVPAAEEAVGSPEEAAVASAEVQDPAAEYIATDPAPETSVQGNRCPQYSACPNNTADANSADAVHSQTAEPAAVAEASAENSAGGPDVPQTASGTETKSDVEIWAVSTEQLNGFTVDTNRLLCWRAEQGQFVPSSVNEYKSTLTSEIPTVVLIHGNMTDWSGALRHAQSLKYRIDQMRARQQIEIPYRLVIWKWPSERQDQRIRSDSQVKAYLADLNGFYLASFLNAIGGTGADVTLLGFSFGARTIGSALELMAGGVSLGRTIPEEMRYTAGSRYHAILLAGACNYGDFSTRGQYAHGSALLSSMVNVFNPVDNALRFYPLLYGPAGPQAVGIAPIDPNTAPTSFKDRLWSINSSAYGPQHNFDNLLYSICDPILGNLVYAGKIWTAADAIPSVSNAVVDPVIQQRSDAEQKDSQTEKTETEESQEATIVAESL